MLKLAKAALAIVLLLISSACLMTLTAMSTGGQGTIFLCLLAANIMIFFLPLRAKALHFVLAAGVSVLIVSGTFASMVLQSSTEPIGRSYEDGQWMDLPSHTPLEAAAIGAVTGLTIFALYLTALLIWKSVVWKAGLVVRRYVKPE